MLCVGVAFGSVALRIFLQDPFDASIGTSLCGERWVYVALWTTPARSQRAVAILKREQDGLATIIQDHGQSGTQAGLSGAGSAGHRRDQDPGGGDQARQF